MSWGYDGLGRVTSKGQTVGTVTRTVGYAYTNGDLAMLTTPSGQSVAFTYTNGQVTGISVNSTALLSSVKYEPFGPARGWTWGNGTTEVRLHNTDGNASQISALESWSYGYDNAFRITSASDSSNSALSWAYGYDSLDRVTNASRTGTTQGFTYDADGNRKTQTGTISGTYSVPTGSNRLNSITGTPARTYTFDQDADDITYAGNTLAFNDRDRLATFMVSSVTTSYVYNALGQRVQKSGGPAGTVIFVYDEVGHLLGEYTSTGALVQETVWFGDTPVATLRPHTGGGIDIYYVHPDHLNSPRMVTRPTDNGIMWRWDTDPFGSIAPNQNPSGLGPFAYNLRFPGQYADVESGLNYNYYRDYDPQTGRYIESDPIGLRAGVNTFSYVGDNPISWLDPSGLVSVADEVRAFGSLAPPSDKEASCPSCQGADRWTYTQSAPCEPYDVPCANGLRAAGIPGPYYRYTRVVSRKCMVTGGLLIEPAKFTGSTVIGKLAPSWIGQLFGWSATTTATITEMTQAATGTTAGLVALPLTVAALLDHCSCER